MEQSVAQVIKEHEAKGKYVHVEGVRTFVLDRGSGEAVLCIHGVPTSSFLYRKVIAELEKLGLRGICVDLPGLGLTERPADFEYTFSNFATFLATAAEVLGLSKFHLVVHDVGGPIGFGLAARHPEKILSLTILNTWVDVSNFKKPLPMRPFEKPLLGEIQLATIQYPTWYLMFAKMGVTGAGKMSRSEIYAYVDLLKREDGGNAFLKIMRHFEHSEQYKALCLQAVDHPPYPVQAIWGAEDPALRYDRYGVEIKEAASLEHVYKLPAKHFLQEESWQEIAELIAGLATQGK